MSTVTDFTKPKLDSVHDLTSGARDYLRRKGVSAKKFDSLPAKAQHQWKEECKVGYYEKNDYELGIVNSKGQIKGQSKSFSVPDLPWKKTKE